MRHWPSIRSCKEEKYKMVRSFALCIGMLLFSTAAQAQLEELARRAGLGNAGGLSDSKVASGLKEALRVGANNAVKLTGKTDGYFGNQAIKILMPSNLRPLGRGLRAIGFGPKVDEFILSMNRSAEAAAAAAKKIFGDAILAMTFDDARKILSGGDTAATEYFKSKTSAQLTAISTVRREDHEPKRSHAAIQNADGSIPVDSFCEKPELGHQQVRRCQGSRRIVL